MTKLTMNQVNLETAIKNLRDLADDCESARDEVVKYYNEEGDTLERHGRREPDDFSSAVNAAITAVSNRADKIERYKNDIVTLNESGVAPMDADGIITLTTPDNVDYPDDSTHTDFVAWAEGVIDATELDSITSGKISSTDRVPSGRSYDEIVASIQAHQNDNDYADTFINRIGPENLTSLPLNAQQYFTYQPTTGDPVNNRPEAAGDLASLLGSVLATASLKWSRERSQQVADAIVSSVDEEGEYGRITVLNAMLGEHDANGDHINDLKFGRDLLIDLAEGLDDIDYKAVAVGASYPERRKGGEGAYFSQGEADARGRILGPSLNGYSFDPLTGVLDAMGNNRFAALGYLAPTAEDGTVDTSRVDELSKRNWDQKGMAGYTAALAAGSSLRGSTIGCQGHQDERATQLSGHAIHDLAQNTTEDKYNDDTKAHIGLLLANCSAEVKSAYLNDSPTDSQQTTGEPAGERLPVASNEDIYALTYRVADSADATATISAGLANHTRQRTQEAIDEYKGSPTDQADKMNTYYTEGAEATGFLVGMAEEKATRSNSQANANNAAGLSSTTAALTAFTTIAVGAVGMGAGPVGAAAASPLGQATASGVITYLAPVMADQLVPDAQNYKSPMDGNEDIVVWGAAVQQAANNQLLSQEMLASADAKFEWIKQDDKGVYYIDLTDATTDDYRDLKSWTTTTSHATSTGDSDHTLISALDDNFAGKYVIGYGRGGSTAKDL